MRALVLKIHLWLALVTGAFIFIVALTGAALVFEAEIDRALNAKTSYVTPRGAALPVEAIVARAHDAFPDMKVDDVVIPDRPDLSCRVRMKAAIDFSVFVNPYTGDILGMRDLSTGDFGRGFARTIHLLHARLMGGLAGKYVVGAITVITLVIIVSGLYLWWGRKIPRVLWSGSWKRVNFDLHNVFGFYAAPFLVYVTLSGVIMSFEGYTDPFLRRHFNTRPDIVPRVKSTVIEGATRLSADAALRVADEALPGAVTTIISVPATPTDAFRVTRRFPEDRSGAGRSRLYIDQYRGQVLYLKSTRTDEVGTKIVNIKRGVHTGDFLGWPTRIIAFISCLFLVGQIVTGVLIWWTRVKVPMGTTARERKESAR